MGIAERRERERDLQQKMRRKQILDAAKRLFYEKGFSAATIEDIAQEAFILVYEEPPHLREPERFPGWLRRIMMTACNRLLRSREAAHEDLSTAADTPTDLAGPDVVAEAKKLKEMILEEIGALSEKNRLVTTLYFINGYSCSEIGDFLDVPLSAVKNRLPGRFFRGG